MSETSRKGIFNVLSKNYSDVRITLVDSIKDLSDLSDRKPDLVFLGMSYVYDSSLNSGKKVWVSEFLDTVGISYTGSDKLALEITKDKPLAKQKVIDAGLSSAKYFVTDTKYSLSVNDFNFSFPVFIKPSNKGGGVGVDELSVAHNFEQTLKKVASITEKQKTTSIIEEYLTGKEFSVAILKDKSISKYSIYPIELVAKPDKLGNRMLSKAVKKSNTEAVSIVMDEVVKSKISELALSVFLALGARDYGRIDIRLDSKGNAHFLEANLMPCLIEGYGSFPKACLMNVGLSFSSTILSIAQLGLMRKNVAFS